DPTQEAAFGRGIGTSLRSIDQIVKDKMLHIRTHL
ncbi:MAG: hypothetical protein ACI906_004824, partial [Candidatus Latescibacterota bacterium]